MTVNGKRIWIYDGLEFSQQLVGDAPALQLDPTNTLERAFEYLETDCSWGGWRESQRLRTNTTRSAVVETSNADARRGVSFGAQCIERLDSGGAPRRQITGQQGRATANRRHRRLTIRLREFEKVFARRSSCSTAPGKPRMEISAPTSRVTRRAGAGILVKSIWSIP
jgi:hypothetical protein